MSELVKFFNLKMVSSITMSSIPFRRKVNFSMMLSTILETFRFSDQLQIMFSDRFLGLNSIFGHSRLIVLWHSTKSCAERQKHLVWGQLKLESYFISGQPHSKMVWKHSEMTSSAISLTLKFGLEEWNKFSHLDQSARYRYSYQALKNIIKSLIHHKKPSNCHQILVQSEMKNQSKFDNI